MAVKLIFFTVNGRPERAEFPSDCPDQDVKDLFRGAAECGPEDLLKLFSPRGTLVNISAALEPNAPDSVYRLEVVATAAAAAVHGQPAGVEPTSDLWSMERRLQGLEEQLQSVSVETPAAVHHVKTQVDLLRDKLEVRARPHGGALLVKPLPSTRWQR